ncbi:MAG: hypothetical protein WA678_00420 [Rhabdochlamydiaceae bacterium]
MSTATPVTSAQSTATPVTSAQFALNLNVPPQNESPSVDGLEFDAAFSPAADKANDQMRITLQEKNNPAQASNSSKGKLKPKCTIFVGGEKYIVTETIGTSTGPQQVGRTKAGWRPIATSLEAMLTARKLQDPNFTVSVARFNPQDRKFEYRPGTGGAPIEELYDETYPHNDVKQRAQEVGATLLSNVGRPLDYLSKPKKVDRPGNSSATRPQAQAANGQLPPIGHPIQVPPTPQEDDLPWYKRLGKKIKSYLPF